MKQKTYNCKYAIYASQYKINTEGLSNIQFLDACFAMVALTSINFLLAVCEVFGSRGTFCRLFALGLDFRQNLQARARTQVRYIDW